MNINTCFKEKILEINNGRLFLRGANMAHGAEAKGRLYLCTIQIVHSIYVMCEFKLVSLFYFKA